MMIGFKDMILLLIVQDFGTLLFDYFLLFFFSSVSEVFKQYIKEENRQLSKQ